MACGPARCPVRAGMLARPPHRRGFALCFNGGPRIVTMRKAAVAAYDQAAAQYRSTVLTAFRNVADTLRALQSDTDTLKAQSVAARAAADSLAIAKQQYSAGAISIALLLDAQRANQQARVALVSAEATRYADTVALFVALGGGWWNRPGDLAARTDSTK